MVTSAAGLTRPRPYSEISARPEAATAAINRGAGRVAGSAAVRALPGRVSPTAISVAPVTYAFTAPSVSTTAATAAAAVPAGPAASRSSAASGALPAAPVPRTLTVAIARPR